MTSREAQRTRDREHYREQDLYAQGVIGHPRDRAWFWGLIGPRRDNIHRASKSTQRSQRRK